MSATLIALLILATGTTLFDVWLTRRRLYTYGTKVELNGVARWLYGQVGFEVGVLITTLPTLLLLSFLAIKLGWLIPLALYSGFRAQFFLFQFQSLAFERGLVGLKKEKLASGNDN